MTHHQPASPARRVRVAVVQAAPHPVEAPIERFEAHVRAQVEAHPGLDVLVYPELHLFGADRDDLDEQNRILRASAVPLDGAFVAELGAIAQRAGVVLVPGSICELADDGRVFNTSLAFDRDGRRLSIYRKIFPWRPTEPYDPGAEFVVFDAPGIGRLGFSICYDAWFPEHARHLAWLGTEAIINVVKTTTPDRAHELVLARSNAIVNQVFVVSVNVAGPIGRGRSIVVDPDGSVVAESTVAEPETLVVDLDLADVARIRTEGTAGCNRMWSQFRSGDPTIPLPLYAGRIDPATWEPAVAPRIQEGPRA